MVKEQHPAAWAGFADQISGVAIEGLRIETPRYWIRSQ
jgi:hypothetical protein